VVSHILPRDISNRPSTFLNGWEDFPAVMVLRAYAHRGACATKLSMNTINTILCCLFLTLAAFAQTAREKDDPQSTKLVVLEHLWNDAQVHRDERALEGMIADSFSDTEWDGEVSERGKFLADIKDPKFKPDLVTIQDLKVNLYHNTGVVTGAYHTKGSYNGKPYDHLGRFTDTWILDDGKWECVASHTSLLKR
jgi:hypothetical protein